MPNDQITINLTDTIPPQNQATIDLNGDTGNTYDKTQLDTKLGEAKLGVKGTAKQANSPTIYDPIVFPFGLFESYKVVEPITSPNNWGNLTVTQTELDENTVFFNVENGVVSKFVSKKLADINNITNITNENTYNLDPSQIVPSEALYNNPLETLAGDILKRVDFYTGEDVNYKETTVWKDGTSMNDLKVDGTIYIKRGAKYYKRAYTGYADVKWFGAKGDGVDLGIGNYEGDHDAINLALRLCKKVELTEGVFVVKKPIVLNSENDFKITGTLQLGKASNCTLLKNAHVDLNRSGDGIADFPVGFKKDKDIKIWGKGILDFNGWYQNKGDDPIALKDNPEVVGTPTFTDSTGIGNEYWGLGAKFADIDGFFMGGGLTCKNSRTWNIYIGNLTNYTFDGLIAERNYFVQNQDFISICGGCFDGVIKNIYGVSGDEFIVLAPTANGAITLRAGDIKRLHISNITYFGINPTATPTSQKPMPTFEDDFPSYRLLRVSTTVNYNVDEITLDGVNVTGSLMHYHIVIAKLPFSGGVTNAEMYAGNGKIGTVNIKNINCPNQEGLIEFSDYAIVKNLNIENIIDRRVGLSQVRDFISYGENFTGLATDFTHSKIENLNIRNVKTILGGGSNIDGSIINFPGEIRNLKVNNYSVTTENDVDQIYLYFTKSNIKNIWIDNCDLLYIDKICTNSNTDGVLRETNSSFRPTKSAETQIFAKFQTQNLKVNSDNVYGPDKGDMIRTSSGMKIYTDALTWNLIS